MLADWFWMNVNTHTKGLVWCCRSGCYVLAIQKSIAVFCDGERGWRRWRWSVPISRLALTTTAANNMFIKNKKSNVQKYKNMISYESNFSQRISDNNYHHHLQVPCKIKSKPNIYKYVNAYTSLVLLQNLYWFLSYVHFNHLIDVVYLQTQFHGRNRKVRSLDPLEEISITNDF